MALYDPTHKKRSSKCFVFFLAVFVILCALVLVFASVVRARNPHVKLRSVTLKRVSYSPSSPSPFFNATMIIFLSIKNPNYGDFIYGKSKVSVLYAGGKIGDNQVKGGRVSNRESKEINVAVKVRSAKAPVTANFYSDINSGSLNLTTNVKFSGTVHLFKFFNFRKATEMACDVKLNLPSNAIKGIQCQ